MPRGYYRDKSGTIRPIEGRGSGLRGTQARMPSPSRAKGDEILTVRRGNDPNVVYVDGHRGHSAAIINRGAGNGYDVEYFTGDRETATRHFSTSEAASKDAGRWAVLRTE